MAEKYKKGMVAQFLGGGKPASEGKFASLFITPAAAEVTPAKTAHSQKKKKRSASPTLKTKKTPPKKKAKVQDYEDDMESDQMETSPQPPTKSEGFNPPPGIVHVALAQASKKSGKKKNKPAVDDENSDSDSNMTNNRKGIKEDKRPRRDRLQKANENRTIFVGNVSLTTNKKNLTRLFKDFGEIESVRFRCAPVGNPTTKKRVAVITKEFHEKRHNISAYICFKEEEAAKKAVSLNGHEFDGLHLRVDSAKPVLKNLSKRSVFVGNLPFAVEEETIRSHFEECGEIENVRVIRDRKTNLGKGICYVLFKSPDSVSLALKLKDSELANRQLRVERCVESSKKKNAKGKKMKSANSKQMIRDKKANNKETTTDQKKKRKKPMWRPTNISNSQVLQSHKSAMKKKQRKVDKKKKHKSRMDEVTRVLGPMQQPSMKSEGGGKPKMKKKGFKAGKKGKKGAR